MTMAIGRFTTITHRSAIAALLAGGVLFVGLLPAAARWQVHNSDDVTQILAPAGGTEAQTCTDRLRGQSGWSTFVPNEDNVSDYVPPSGSNAYGPVNYNFWKAPAGYASGTFQESNLTPGAVDFYPDGGSDPVPAIHVRDFTTPSRAQITPTYLYPDQVDTDPFGGNLYLFSRATWGALLPGLRYGDQVAIKPSGEGSTFANVTAIHCDATRMHLHFVRYNPPGRDTSTQLILNKEAVVIVNGTTQIRQLRGWRLADKDGHVYRFPATQLKPGQSVTVHTGPGTNRPGHRYWGRTSHVWDNGGEEAVLRTSTRTKVDSCSWGSAPGWVFC